MEKIKLMKIHMFMYKSIHSRRL